MVRPQSLQENSILVSQARDAVQLTRYLPRQRQANLLQLSPPAIRQQPVALSPGSTSTPHKSELRPNIGRETPFRTEGFPTGALFDKPYLRCVTFFSPENISFEEVRRLCVALTALVKVLQ